MLITNIRETRSDSTNKSCLETRAGESIPSKAGKMDIAQQNYRARSMKTLRKNSENIIALREQRELGKLKKTINTANEGLEEDRTGRIGIKLKHPQIKLILVKHFYLNRLPRLWNSLPYVDLDLSISVTKGNLKITFGVTSSPTSIRKMFALFTMFVLVDVAQCYL